MKRLTQQLLMALPLCLSQIACGPELSRSSEVDSVRVLGVQKDKTMPAPGDSVEYRLLWHDPKGRDLAPLWFVLDSSLLGQAPLGEGDVWPICNNPPGDSYFVCLELIKQVFGQSDELLPTLQALPPFRQDSITIDVPRSLWGGLLPDATRCEDGEPPELPDGFAEAESLFPLDQCQNMTHPSADPRQPNFGSYFVLFALCAGELRYEASAESGFPIVCEGNDGELLGPEDYVFGYTQTFVYETGVGLSNQNPVMEPRFVIDGEEVDACLGEECDNRNVELPTDCSDGVVCLDVCTEEEEEACPTVEIAPVIPETFLTTFEEPATTPTYCEPEGDAYRCPNAEPDKLSEIAYGRLASEQMWIRYYVDQGRAASEVRLLNDSQAGWNEDYGTELRLPLEEGPIAIWAVTYDNRGGQNWVRAFAYAK